jgi:hypothetical protein
MAETDLFVALYSEMMLAQIQRLAQSIIEKNLI